MDQDLQDMIEMSREVGGEPRLVQGGGGNTSVKTAEGRRMYVKASGTGLGEMTAERGHCLIELEPALAMLKDRKVAALPAAEREREVLSRLVGACVDDLGGRPSVESSLHALLGRCVLHTHPSIVNGLLCARNGREELEALFSQWEPPYLYLPYIHPGYPLAASLCEQIASYRQRHARPPEVVFLENHGLFVSAEHPQKVLDTTRQLFTRIESRWQKRWNVQTVRAHPDLPAEEAKRLAQAVQIAVEDAYRPILDGRCVVRFGRSEPIRRFFQNPRAVELSEAGPLVPDQVVHCKGSPLWIPVPGLAEGPPEAACRLIKSHDAGTDTPRCLLLDGVGLFAVGESNRFAEAAFTMMQAVLETLVVADCFGGPRSLRPEAIRYVREWEVEQFRGRLAAEEE